MCPTLDGAIDVVRAIAHCGQCISCVNPLGSGEKIWLSKYGYRERGGKERKGEGEGRERERERERERLRERKYVCVHLVKQGDLILIACKWNQLPATTNVRLMS